MNKQQKFRAEFLMLCDEYDIDASDMSRGFLNEAYNLIVQTKAKVDADFTDTDIEPNFTKTLWVDHIKGQNIAEGDFEYKYVINALVTDGKDKEFIKIAFNISAIKEIAQMLIDSI